MSNTRKAIRLHLDGELPQIADALELTGWRARTEAALAAEALRLIEGAASEEELRAQLARLLESDLDGQPMAR